ncbi:MULTISPECIES: LysR family transcriptional regulator [unclassified Streptomyces]|uniref:LysR family transcriptional regulator n=1 Tax=unclassified Streptomyces TaxID=2593676 RepID=UPI00224EC1D4|nr:MULTISPECIES: LysR family transcriptional regulator [unclassified Streptomyces]MCX5140007.1 LysR family transcriptional regulator [Streptomyces sp. NBC_00338]WRZ64629.1 LysR family transcriptional regulator [Streptomyces sp. NBC_01257]WSU58600.1 LysR family transcriptional regulator [Streptomyces sp. NBC_01104]
MRVTQSSLDLNLLVALDVLLEESSVSGAAARLHLSEPAMSRTLGRIRKALGDPVLVRAGRTMVPTAHARAIHGEVRAVVERARGVFLSGGKVDLRALSRTFTVVGQDTLAATAGAALFARIAEEAPGVRLRFLMESHVDAPFLREGAADLEVGVIDTRSPEVHREHLFEDHMVGVVRPGHPLLSGELTPARFAAAEHLTVSRRGRTEGPVDTALAELGLRRKVVGSVGTFPSSLFILLGSDLVGLANTRTRTLTDTFGLRTFEIPLPLPPLPFGLAWHPRDDADPAHVWLRGCFREVMTRA